MPPRITTKTLLEKLESAASEQSAYSPEEVESLWTFMQNGRYVIDNRVCDPKEFFWMHPVYRITRTDLFGKPAIYADSGRLFQAAIPPKFSAGLLFRKASQMGATVFSVLLMIWLCIDPDRPLSIGCYWPTQGDVETFVKMRFNPFLEENPKLKELILDSKADSLGEKLIGRSKLYFRYVKGKTQADSLPLDVVIGDEIRLWETAEDTTQRLWERVTQSKLQLMIYMSTVGSKGDFMEQQWAISNQLKWFTACKNGCHTELASDPASENRVLKIDQLEASNPALRLIPGVVLSDFLPEVFIANRGKGNVYVCPCCSEPIVPQNGEYVETRPDAEGMFAMEFAKTLLPNISASLFMQKYREARDRKQFFNGWLAKPFLDPESRPVKEEDWIRNRAQSVTWDDRGRGRRTFLGADFRAREMHWLVGALGETDDFGRPTPGQILRVGVFQGSDWQGFLRDLIADFGIEAGVIDYAPFYTQTLEIADEFDGIIRLAQYRAGDMLRTNADNKRATKKVSPDARERHMALLDQVKTLNYSLKSFADGNWLVPQEPLYMEQFIDSKKHVHEQFDLAEGMEGAGREGLKQHLLCLALVNKKGMTTNESGERVHEAGMEAQEFIDAGGFDPHWAHAFNYMVMASLLSGGEVTVYRSPQGTEAAFEGGIVRRQAPEDVLAQAHRHGGLPTATAIKRVSDLKTCGTCIHGPEQGRANCAALGWEVEAWQPQCNYAGVYRKRIS